MLPGWILSLLVLAPNLLMLAFPPMQVHPPDREPSPRFGVLTMLLERVGQVGCFSLPFLYSANTRDAHTLLALEFMLAALLFYWLGWARYLTQGRRFCLLLQPLWGLPLPMAVAPIAYFFAASFAFRSWFLLAAACALGIGHLAVSIRDWRRYRGWNGSCNT
jgi:hypothetical protein